MNLYWVETGDHDEDWFVVAEDEQEATVYFEDAEGYGEGDAIATFVVAIDPSLGIRPGWPQLDQLKLLGATVKSDGDAGRVVEINGVTYCEGLLEGEIRRYDELRKRLNDQGID